MYCPYFYLVWRLNSIGALDFHIFHLDYISSKEKGERKREKGCVFYAPFNGKVEIDVVQEKGSGTIVNQGWREIEQIEYFSDKYIIKLRNKLKTNIFSNNTVTLLINYLYICIQVYLYLLHSKIVSLSEDCDIQKYSKIYD